MSCPIEEVRVSRRFNKRKNLLEFAAAVACSHENYGEQRWAEFGVREGRSARRLCGLLPDSGRLDLFDSWEGLPEDWNLGDEVVPRGHFACAPPAELECDRVRLIRGWFDATLPAYVRALHPERLTLVHLDCDLYSSTKTVLDAIPPIIGPGTVLVFDDLFGYKNWRHGQWRAWEESGIEGRWLAHTPTGQALVKVRA